MGTVIRVRGKKGNRSMYEEQIRDDRHSSQHDEDHAASLRSDQYSYLEGLPLEILENIYETSGSLALSQTCRRLRKLLHNDRCFKRKLAVQAFEVGFLGDGTTAERENAWERRSTGEKVQNLAIWRSLVAHPDFRFSWFQELMVQWMLSRIEHAFMQWREKYRIVYDAQQHAEHMVFLGSVMRNGLPKELDDIKKFRPGIVTVGVPLMLSLGQTPPDDAVPGCFVRVWMKDNYTSTSNRDIRYPTEVTLNCFYGFKDAPSRQSFQIAPKKRSAGEGYNAEVGASDFIPRALCQPPFTQDKGDALMFLLSISMNPLRTLDIVPQPPLQIPEGAADTKPGREIPVLNYFDVGLTSALTQPCYVAVTAFAERITRHVPDCQNTPCPIWYKHHIDDKSRLQMNQIADTTHGFALPEGMESWKQLPPWWSEYLCRRSPQASLTEEHLMACVVNLPRCLKVYTFLLHNMVYCLQRDCFYTIPAKFTKLSQNFLNTFYNVLQQQTDSIAQVLSADYRRCVILARAADDYR